VDVEHIQATVELDGFCGVARIQHDGRTIAEFAAGMADRANLRPNKITTSFAAASVTKGLTALTVLSLIETGELSLHTPISAVIGDALSGIDTAVTIDHLLTHRSGVGDYIYEEVGQDIDDHVLGGRPAHTLQTQQTTWTC